MNNLPALLIFPRYWNKNTFSPTKLRNRALLVRDYLAGRTVVRGKPVVLQIEVTNRCTMRCAMCPRSHMTRPVVDMEYDLFCRIVDENRHNAEFAILHLMGEPLLNKQLPEMIRYCHDAGIRTVISTNASVLEPDLDDALVDSGLDIIIFSMDGFDAETFSNLRRGGDYSKILANVDRFLSRKGSRTPQAIVQMIDMPETRGQTAPYLKYWGAKPGVIVAIKPFTSWQGNIEEIRKKGWNRDLTCLEHSRCDRLWMWLTVFADGRVATCCRDYDATVDIGNLKKTSCAEAWNGAGMQAFRASHLKGRSCTGVCRVCDYDPIVGRSTAARIAFRLFDQYTLYRLLYLLERQPQS
jgi:MoaA/NifB/PqqE/SkfB family radical SAM enzyme